MYTIIIIVVVVVVIIIIIIIIVLPSLVKILRVKNKGRNERNDGTARTRP